MAIKKEWRCESCDSDFESAVGVCKKCGSQARRAFRTAPGISAKGSISRQTDRLLERNFARRGISNYSNRDGAPKITWEGTFPAGDWRGGGWGKEQLGKINAQFGSSFVEPTLSGPKQKEIVVPGEAPPKGQAGWQGLVNTELINKQ